MFYQHRYRTYGVEIAEGALEEASEFCREADMELNIVRGDMRSLPFVDEMFSNIYTFNTIFFMTKPDIWISMQEIARVLKRGGLCYANFVSVDDPDDRPFCETAPARSLLKSERFAKHQDDEADAYFAGFEILRKEKRWVDKAHGSGRLVQVDIEYTARKK